MKINYLKMFFVLVAFMSVGKVMCSEADELYKKASDIERNSNDYNAALMLYLQANDAFVAEGRGESAEIAQSYHNTGRVYNNLKNVSEGRRYTKKALDLRKKLFGEENEDYITSLNNYALTFFMENDYETAIAHQTQVLNLCDRLESKHPNYGLYAINLGRFYYLSDDYVNAAKYLELAMPEVEKFGELYEFILEYLGFAYIELNDTQNIARIMALAQEHNDHEMAKPCEDLQCMLERAEYFGNTGDHTSAKEWYLKALDLPGDATSKAIAHEAYAKYLMMTINDWTASADYYAMAAALRRQSEGESESFAKLMYLSAVCCSSGKDYKRAIENFEPVIDYYSRIDSRVAQENLAKCNKSVGDAYSGLREHAIAIGYYSKVVDYYVYNDTASEEYPRALLRLAQAETFNGDYDVSIAHHKQAMDIFKCRGMYEDYDSAASSLQMCYFYSGQSGSVEIETDEGRNARNAKLDEIIKQEIEFLDLSRDYLGQLVYAGSLATIAGCYATKEEYITSLNYYKQYMAAVRKAVAEEFRMQSEDERMITWEQESSRIKDIYYLLMTLPTGNEALMPDFSALCYDAALLSKGILLKSSIEFEKILLQYGDSSLRNKYTLIKSNDAEISRLRQTATSEAEMEAILSLTRQNQGLQMELYRECSEFADFTDYISYDWRDVRAALDTTDVAIEFVAIKTGPFDRENYNVALVLTRDMVSPIAVPVCSFSTANAMSNDSTLYNTDSPELVWGMLRPILEGKRRVFFSADGAFNRIGIEYLRYNGCPLSEQFEVYRLSTTKELCYKHTEQAVTHVALFGDIDYTFNASSQSTDDRFAKMRGEQFVNLDYTLKEITAIDAILKGKGVVTAVIKGEDAGEDVFKSLSDSKVNIIHVASHGGYKNDTKSTDEDAMKNSILAFSGANLADDNTDKQHDGLVTAADVAKMNLRRCDLAVLSACETGLGKLGEDGVYGLQRGFKNAGVRTLLMSIKNVYDESTAMLMESFYRYLMNGCDKRLALVNAQRDLRENGYAEGRYWATFILLDAFSPNK